MNGSQVASEGRKEACKTYIEQTKLLVTLASAFLVAPAGLAAMLKDKEAAALSGTHLGWLITTELLFIASVLMGYIVLGCVAGSQDDSSFDIYRPMTRFSSLFQFALYLGGLASFITLAVLLSV